MIIFMGIEKKHHVMVILLLLSFCLMVSCKKEIKEISLLRESLINGNAYCGPVSLYPLKLCCKDTKDTIWNIIIADELYKRLNILFCDYDSFAELLADRVEKDGYLMVDSACFALYRQDTIVKNAMIDSIYQKEGVHGILENYVTQNGEMAASTFQQLEYLVFLLYQHRILCCFGPDPAFVMFVYFYATGKEEEYMKVLESSKSTMYICPFYLSGKDSLDYINELKMNGEAWKLE